MIFAGNRCNIMIYEQTFYIQRFFHFVAFPGILQFCKRIKLTVFIKLTEKLKLLNFPLSNNDKIP